MKPAALIDHIRELLERLRGECISPHERAKALELLEKARKELDK